MKLNQNEIKTIINESITKTDNKLDVRKIKEHLTEKLNQKYSFYEFYKSLMDELKNIFNEIHNSFDDNNLYSKVNKKLDYFFKAFDIFLYFPSCCPPKEAEDIVNKKNINDFLMSFVKIFDKMTSKEKEYKKNKNGNSIINQICEYIYDINKVLLDVNSGCTMQTIFSEKKIFLKFLKNRYSRVILYDGLKKAISQEKRNSIFKDQEYIINEIINYLMEEIKSNKIILFEDIKKLFLSLKNFINPIKESLIKLIKKIIDLYSKEFQNHYDKLFEFFFNKIIFDEIKYNKGKITYNQDFLNVLFEIYKYLVKNNKKDIYDIFLIQLFNSINSEEGSKQKKFKKGVKKYKWLSNETKYYEIIVNSFPEIFNENFFMHYLMLLMNLLTDVKSGSKEDNFLPEQDLVLFFRNLNKYLNNNNYGKEFLLNLFIAKISSLMNKSTDIIGIILQKCNPLEILIQLIESENNYNLKMKLFDFIEKILSASKGNFEYTLNIDIREATDEISMKYNLISIGYELDNNKYNDKILKIIEIMNKYICSKEINNFLKMINLIFTIIIDYKFKEINSLTDDIIININNLILQVSNIFSNTQKDKDTKKESNLENIIIYFLNIIFKFIFQFNMKKFEYKEKRINEKNALYYTKRIIDKKILKNIIKNMLLTKINPTVKKITFDYLKNFAINKTNNIILSSRILYLIIKIYYQDKNYNNLQKMFNLLFNSIKAFSLNAKILLNFDFISITIDILQEIYLKDKKTNDEEDCYKKGFLFLKEISKYLNQELLMKYINKLFIIFNKNVLNQIGEQKNFENENSSKLFEDSKMNGGSSKELYDLNVNGRVNIGYKNNENIDFENDYAESENEEEKNNSNVIEMDNNNSSSNNSKLCFELFELLKNYLKKYKENDNNEFINKDTSNYVILSNYSFPNHLINNIMLINNLKYNGNDNYIYFRIVLKINTYDELTDFNFLKLRGSKAKIVFLINKNVLEITEENSENKKITLYKIQNFDKVLPADDKYHNCIIIFNVEEKTINMVIDDKEIMAKSEKYNTFNFKSFNMIIGFNHETVNDTTNDIKLKLSQNEIKNDDAKPNTNSCFIHISYLLVLNTIIENNQFLDLIKKEKYFFPNGNLLSGFNREKNKNYGKNVILEFDFQNKNINITNLKELQNKMKYGDNLTYKNKYISYIENSNFLSDGIRNIYLYMISKNPNIYEYYSLNNFCELDRLNKSKISSEIFDDYDLVLNFCNIYIFDLLIGFLFLIEKRFNDLKNKDIDNEKSKKKETMCAILYGENFILNNDIIIEYIQEIFEILSLIPSENIKNYFLKGDSKSNIIKIKYFFYNNISLLNDNDIIGTILSFYSLENKNKDSSIQKIIFIEILNEIFLHSLIFEKLSSKNQNKILSNLYDFLINYNFKENKKYFDYLFRIVRSLVIIFVLNDCIVDENKEGKTKFDYIISSINLIISSTIPSEDENYEKKIKKLFKEVNGFYINLQKDIEQDSNFIKENFEKYKYIFTFSNPSKMDIYEEQFNMKMNKIINNIQTFYNLITKNEKILSFIKDNNDVNECRFCDFLRDLFVLKKNFIFNEFTYEKLYNRFFRNYYLNFGENPEIFENKKYVWNLSLKESHSKIQNKLFLKENHIKYFSYEHPNSKKIINYFNYDYGKEKYEKRLKELYYLSFIDRICKHKSLIKAINPFKTYICFYNCLIINKLHKILSTIILNDDSIIIYYNICLDNENKINVVKSEVTQSLWTKNKEEFQKELADYLKRNEEEIKKDIFEAKNEENLPINKKWNKFNYNKSYKFSRRILYLKKINEIFKRQHLHISNSLEIFMNNGESYFIVLIPENRDVLFDSIIKRINYLYKDKENKLEIYKLSRLNTAINKENLFYMKHFPISNSSQDLEIFLKGNKRKGSTSNFNNSSSTNYKIILEESSLKEEICNEWSKNKITNYDYLMLLNTLGGRSLNHLSQYFIFPWIIHDFNSDILNWLSDKIYRDLSIPIFACGEDIERVINKYDLTDDEKYHSGTFYSTHSFVCYFLIRQNPFTEIHLEIQGAKFDSPSRMFNGVEQLSNLSEKYQELIPSLYNLPELYIKTNYIFEDKEKFVEPINEYKFPNWSKNDPRKFSLILRKLLESEKISQTINLWIDLIFGYKQKGQNALKALNTYRQACYPFSKNELEMLESNKELESHLYEKEEMGVLSKQLFTKSHKVRELEQNKRDRRIFFNSDDKIKNLKIEKIRNQSYIKLVKNSKENRDKENKENNFFDISDIIFSKNSPLYKQKNDVYQGGISSLSSIMNTLEEPHIKIIDINKTMKQLEEEKNFIVLNKRYKYLRKHALFLAYNSKCIEICNISENESYRYSFFLNEIGDISCLTTNEKGTKLYLGFSNGKINEYKIIKLSNFKNDIIDETIYISPSSETEIDKKWIEQNIFKTEEDFSNFFPFRGNNNITVYLKPTQINYFSYNNPHIPRKINLLSLNEYHNVLIALDESNFIYIISLNNNYKLMHLSAFLTGIHYKMKEILPLSWNGDFIIYSSYTVYLFSINGIPLCQLNLLEKIYDNIANITCCKAVFLYDIILFTAHRDGSINVWKIKNKNISEKFDERISYIFNSKKSISFLPEYEYGYNSKHNWNNKFKISDYELQRKFENVNKINGKEESKTYYNFMKMSNDLDYIILMDNQKNLFIFTTNFENIKKTAHKNKNKDRCYNCGRKLLDFGIRPTLINPNFPDNYDDNNSAEDDNQENDNNNDNTKIDNNPEKLICEECKQILIHTENYLYN